MVWMDALKGEWIAFSRQEKRVFRTEDQQRYWEVLQLLAENGIQHRGVVRYGEARQVVEYQVYVKKQDFVLAAQKLQEKGGVV